MPLPSGSITLSAGESSRQPKPAYLIKFPEDAWERLQDDKRDGGEVSVSLDGSMVSSRSLPLRPDFQWVCSDSTYPKLPTTPT